MNRLEQLVLGFAKWIGSIQSLVAHTVLFTGIISLILFGVKSTDVLLILTSFGTMECVYLGIIIQISVNRQSTELREVEEEVHIIHGDVEVLTHKNTSGEPERASGT